MMKEYIVSGFILLAAAAASFCCQANDSVSAQEETYIPLITNSWIDENNLNHKFNLVAKQDSVSSGTFTGEETYDDSTFSFPLTGMFSNRNVSFTVSRRGNDVSYAGRFVADTLMDFGGLKLFRHSQ